MCGAQCPSKKKSTAGQPLWLAEPMCISLKQHLNVCNKLRCVLQILNTDSNNSNGPPTTIS